MKSCIINVSIGKRYEKLQSRLIQSFKDVDDPIDIIAWLNTLPSNAPQDIELPYLAYCAKPFAMMEAYKQGYELLLWVDAACIAVNHSISFFNFIENNSYYVQDNGWNVGQWSSDICLKTMNIDREYSFKIPEISTMVLGLNMKKEECKWFLNEWCKYAADKTSFIAPHTNDIGPAFEKGCAYRGIGKVSIDNRVYGHRHDQTVASILSHKLNWTRTPRPIFVDYLSEKIDERTILINKG